MRLRHFAAPFAITALLSAQTQPCFAMNDQSTSVSNAIYAMGPQPNVYGWQFTSPTTLVVQSARIFTGNNYASQVGLYMRLELWSHDPVTNLPLARLASGTWQHHVAISWQGANLDAPVVVPASTPFWIVFVDPAWSTVPTQPGGATMPYARFANSVWVTANASALKIRLYCGLLDDQIALPVGAPCANSAGLGTLFTNESAVIGNAAFAVDGSGFPGNTLALLALGLMPTWPSIPLPGGPTGCMIHTDIASVLSGFTGTGDVRAPTALGHVRFGLAIPSNPVLAGLVVTGQIAALDPVSTFPVPLVSTNALRFQL
jgi:hypothetical protein